jgi:hypothetical protein
MPFSVSQVAHWPNDAFMSGRSIGSILVQGFSAPETYLEAGPWIVVKSATNSWLQETKMSTNLKTLLPAAILGLTGTAHASPINVDVTVTVDNVYAIYSGNETDIYDFHGTAANTTSGQISIPETYNFSMDDGDIIYIAAWSDDGQAQGLLAEFSIDGTILTTANSQWEVMATGINLGILDPAPTMAELTTQINLANAGSVLSGGWVNTTLGNFNDPVFGPGGSVPVPSMAPTLQWAWYHQPGYTADTFVPGHNHDEYLVFRLEFPIGGCCVDDTCYNMTPDDCEMSGGIYSDILCEDVDWVCEEEPDTGACCLDSADGAVCLETSEVECMEQAGDWYGLGTNCVDVLAECEADPDPDPILGACCIERPDGPQCVEVTKDICKISEGNWFGEGTLCVDVYEECMVEEEPEFGACCVKGECLETTEDECEDFVGDFNGPGTSCLDATITCDDDGGDPVSTDPGGAISDGDISDGDAPHDASTPSPSCSTVGALDAQGLSLLLVGILGLIRRRRVF